MNYYAQRALQWVITVWAVVTISFVLIRYIPGGPMDYIIGLYAQEGMPTDRIATLAEVYVNIRPDEPLYVQYFDYVFATFSGDLGTSTWYQASVSGILGRALPWTIFLMSHAIILTYLLAVAWGGVMAYKEGSRFDLASTGIAMLGASFPYYLLALLLITVVSAEMGWFPMRGRYDYDLEVGFTLTYIGSLYHHAALPILSMVATSAGIHALTMRGNSISILGQDYMRVGRLRGLPNQRLALRYVARNAILPMYTAFLISIGFMFGGSIVIEEIFTYPGVGYYMFVAIQTRDYPLMMGAFILITIAVCTAVLFADLTYGRIDPRIKTRD